MSKRHTVVNCPFCSGVGELFVPSKQAFTLCKVCLGNGRIITDAICACGVPVNVESKDGFLYCGRDICLSDLRADAREAKFDESYQRRDLARMRGAWGWEQMGS